MDFVYCSNWKTWCFLICFRKHRLNVLLRLCYVIFQQINWHYLSDCPCKSKDSLISQTKPLPAKAINCRLPRKYLKYPLANPDKSCDVAKSCWIYPFLLRVWWGAVSPTMKPLRVERNRTTPQEVSSGVLALNEPIGTWQDLLQGIFIKHERVILLQGEQQHRNHQ